MNNSTISFTSSGLTEAFLQEAARHPGLFLARVSSQHKDLYRVITASGEIRAEPSGKMGYLANDLPDYPAVGDYVMVDRLTDDGGNAIIRHILPRRIGSPLRACCADMRRGRVLCVR